MLTCVITGKNDVVLVKYTLDRLKELETEAIIVATTKPCEEPLCIEYQSETVQFLNKTFSNGNEARNCALENTTDGRVLFLEAGAKPVKKALEIHCKAKESEVVCGLFTRLYDFEENFQDGIVEKEYEKREDGRRRLKQRGRFPWNILRDHNISIHVKNLRQLGQLDTVFCVDGLTQNAQLAYGLYQQGMEFRLEEEAQIDVYTRLDQVFLQPAKLERLFIWLTDRCNFHCRMCRIGQKAYSPLRYTEPTLEEVKKLILAAKKAGASKVELYGGEMLVRKDLFEIIEYCNQLGIEPSFVSNGSLITEEAARELKRLKVQDIPISLDGPDEERNNWVRGENAWNGTMEGIRCLKKHAVPFSIFTVVLKQNYHYLKEMVTLAKELGAESISFQPVSSRQGGEQYDSLSLEFTDIEELKKEILEAFEVADSLNFPIRSKAMVKAIPEYILRGEQLLLQKGCSLPYHDALITKTGKLQLCFSAYGPGKLYQKAEGETFMKVWQMPSYKILRRMAGKGQCTGCLANCSDQEYLLNDNL